MNEREKWAAPIRAHEFFNEHGWEVRSAAGTEWEVQLFLGALVRMVKPRLVVETGCYDGHTTRVLAWAISENGGGRLVSCDTDESRVREARGRLWPLPLSMVDIRHCRGDELPELCEADMVFCDSDYPARPGEILLAKPGAIVVVHDTRISYHGDVPPHEGLVKQYGGVCFQTHRGVGVLLR